MATFTALYKMRIFNFEDVMREMKLSHAGTSTPYPDGNRRRF
jgi:hypothetical protein